MATMLDLLLEQVRPGVGPVEADIPETDPTLCQIKMSSNVFGTDPTLWFRLLLEESFDDGLTYAPASGFPIESIGGSAGGPRNSDGLPVVQYYYDGRARRLRVTSETKVNGESGEFSYGLTASLI